MKDYKVADRAELALMGKVVPVTKESEVQEITDYITTVVKGDEFSHAQNILGRINRYSNNHVRYIVVNTIEGMPCISYLLEDNTDDTGITAEYPAPFEEDYGTGCPCAFCYVLNLDCPDFSEFGDCFFSKKSDGFYHRVS